MNANPNPNADTNPGASPNPNPSPSTNPSPNPSTNPNGPRRPWWALVAAWLATFFAFASVAHGNFESTDTALTMHAARALWQRGDSGLQLESPELGERLAAGYLATNPNVGGKLGQNGRVYVWFPMGHVWLMVPLVALGELLQRWVPQAEATFRAHVAPGASDAQLAQSVSYTQGYPVLTQGLICLLPAAFAATSLLLLFWLARAFGAGRRDAVITVLAIGFGTQCFALGQETLSDGPGLCCLLAALLVTVRSHQDDASRRLMFAGGVAAGAAVLLRYQNGLLVPAFVVVMALASRRRGCWAGLLWFLLGGLPFLALLLGVDMARFGDPFDTGYPKADAWFDQPIWLGVTKLLFAAGRGMLWCSPLLWLALPLWLRARPRLELRWLAGVLFVVPLVLFASARGWQGGQCWGSRYVTPGIVVLLVIVLPQTRPWLTWPRTWRLLLGLGLLVSLTSVVAPTRGVVQLATQAVEAANAHAVAEGRLSAAAAAAIDPADVLSWQPRYSQLHANWTYAWHSWRGGFEQASGQPRDGSAHTIEPLFGISAVTPAQGSAPVRWEDRHGRHLWWRFWGDLLGVPGWWLGLPGLLLSALFAWFGWRRL